VAAVLLIADASAARAHDYWIQPSSFHPNAGDELGVGLRVGDGGAGDPARRNAARIEKFVAAGPAGEHPIGGADGDDPAGHIRLAEPGAYLLEYRSRPSFIEMKPAEFTAYLKEEGLDGIDALRQRRGQAGQPGREVYSRCLKSVIRVGAGQLNGLGRTLGCRLEIIPETDPSGPGPQGFRLLFDGKPLSGVLLKARRPSARAPEVQARTNRDGSVRLALNGPGEWIVTAVHMTAAQGPVEAFVKAGEPSRTVSADWRSVWASLTFERP